MSASLISDPTKPPCRSSLFEKLDAVKRDKLDRAILSYEPAGYTDVYKLYKLREAGISFTAFYYYARRLRADASRAHLAELCPEKDDKLLELIPRILTQTLSERLMMDDASPLDIQRLVNATRIAIANIHSAANVAACAPAGHGHESPLETRAARATSRSTSQQLEVGDDPDAPHGRNEDGSPRTHEQYCATVKQVLFEVYAPKSVKEAAAAAARKSEVHEVDRRVALGDPQAAKQNPEQAAGALPDDALRAPACRNEFAEPGLPGPEVSTNPTIKGHPAQRLDEAAPGNPIDTDDAQHSEIACPPSNNPQEVPPAPLPNPKSSLPPRRVVHCIEDRERDLLYADRPRHRTKFDDF